MALTSSFSPYSRQCTHCECGSKGCFQHDAMSHSVVVSYWGLPNACPHKLDSLIRFLGRGEPLKNKYWNWKIISNHTSVWAGIFLISLMTFPFPMAGGKNNNLVWKRKQPKNDCVWVSVSVCISVLMCVQMCKYVCMCVSILWICVYVWMYECVCVTEFEWVC